MNVTKVKAAVRLRDGMSCTRCRISNDEHKKLTGRQLEVHRVQPGSKYSTAPGVCVTLCRVCHGSQPRRRRGQPDLAFPGWLKTYVSRDVFNQLVAYIAAYNALEECAGKATFRSTIEAALRMYLKAKGFWPPPSSSP